MAGRAKSEKANHVFTAIEYANMLLCLGAAEQNAKRALELYKQKYPKAHWPKDGRVIVKAFERIRENRPICPQARGGGRDMPANIVEKVLDIYRRNPSIGSRSIAKLIRDSDGKQLVSHSCIRSILKKEGAAPQTPNKLLTKTRPLLSGDQNSRMAFCKWLLDEQEKNPRFVQNIIWTGDCVFSKNGPYVSKSTSTPSTPASGAEGTAEPVKNDDWAIYVWAGVFDNEILGPVYFDEPFNGHRYLEFLNNFIGEFMDNLPLEKRKSVWFQHDSSPSHSALSVRKRLNEYFGERWIGKFGKMSWPAQSSDLTPVSFHIWDYVKYNVYYAECNTAEEARERLDHAFESMKLELEENPKVLEAMHKHTIYRARVCLVRGGVQIIHEYDRTGKTKELTMQEAKKEENEGLKMKMETSQVIPPANTSQANPPTNGYETKIEASQKATANNPMNVQEMKMEISRAITSVHSSLNVSVDVTGEHLTQNGTYDPSEDVPWMNYAAERVYFKKDPLYNSGYNKNVRPGIPEYNPENRGHLDIPVQPFSIPFHGQYAKPVYTSDPRTEELNCAPSIAKQ